MQGLPSLLPPCNIPTSGRGGDTLLVVSLTVSVGWWGYKRGYVEVGEKDKRAEG